MISAKQAAINLKRKYPKREVTAVIDYDKDWWIVEAPENGKADLDAPYYAVSKTNGSVKTYSPMADFDKFSEVYPDNIVDI